jgi:hypothetical protein
LAACQPRKQAHPDAAVFVARSDRLCSDVIHVECKAVIQIGGQHRGSDVGDELAYHVYLVRGLDRREVYVSRWPTQVVGREQYPALEHEFASVRRISETKQESFKRIQPKIFGGRAPCNLCLLSQCQEGLPSDSGLGRSGNFCS